MNLSLEIQVCLTTTQPCKEMANHITPLRSRLRASRRLQLTKDSPTTSRPVPEGNDAPILASRCGPTEPRGKLAGTEPFAWSGRKLTTSTGQPHLANVPASQRRISGPSHTRLTYVRPKPVWSLLSLVSRAAISGMFARCMTTITSTVNSGSPVPGVVSKV